MKRFVKKEMIQTLLIWTLTLLSGCAGGDPKEPGKTAVAVAKTAPPVDSSQWNPLVYDTTRKYIYLTFDDGPQHGTVTCYDICRSLGVKASFFMVGQHSEQKSDGRKIVKMIRDGYPQSLLANHSYSHAYNRYLDFYHHPDSALNDFLHAQQVLGMPWKIIRLPGNPSWVREGEIKATPLVRPVAERLDSAGFNITGWDLEWGFRKKTARPVQSPELLVIQVDSAFARNETHVKNHLVILTHDRMFQRPEDAEALDRFIRLLKRNPAYIFETMDHYPGLKKGAMK